MALLNMIPSSTPTAYVIMVTPTPMPQIATEAPEEDIEAPSPDDSFEPTPTLPFLSTPGANFNNEPVSEQALDSLKTLEEAVVPYSDPRGLMERLNDVADIPETMPDAPKEYNVGDQEKFWVTNVDTNENFQVTTVLRYETEHSYFWIEKGVRYLEKDLKELAEEFENHIYPTDRSFFGSEWTPGVDNDEHIYIIYAGNLGVNLGGYFSSNDSLHPLAHKYSNAHETFVFNADGALLGEEYTYGILAHEFQHMIHWYHDRNEDSWLDEGFAELATYLNGFTTGEKYYEFVSNPDYQIMNWPSSVGDAGPNYGGSFLFVNYFLDRFGEKVTQALVANQENGLDSIDAVLKEQGIKDKASGAIVTADDVFADWWVTNYLLDGEVGDGRYKYGSLTGLPNASDTETVYECPSAWQERDVKQYGVDYIKINCPGKYKLQFSGETMVDLLPSDPHSGDYTFWSNMGNQSDMSLTRTFDLRGAEGKITFKYWMWYDLEADYDYVYLEVSEDGEKWEIIKAPSATDENPSGNSYGWGYNGASSNWVEEKVDLSDYAGKNIWLRFEYVTDAAVNGTGLLLDDFSIPEIGYSQDLEESAGGWESAGFVRVSNALPQTFRIMLIRRTSKGATVEPLAYTSGETLELPLELGDDLSSVTLVVGGTTRFTRQAGVYRFQLIP